MDGNSSALGPDQHKPTEEETVENILLRFHSDLPSDQELDEIDKTLDRLGFYREMRLRTVDCINRSKFIIDCSYVSKNPANRKEVEREIRAMRLVYSLKAIFA